MRVRLSDAAFVNDLISYLEATECSVRKVGPVTLDVSIPRAPSDDQALREIALYLRTWQAMNPEAHAHVLGEGEPDPD